MESGVRFVEGDLEDAEGMRALLQGIRPSVVFHLAAYGAYADQKDAGRILQTTVMGTWNLLQACVGAGVGMVVSAGSSSEYGTKDHPMREDECIAPNSYYAVGKATQTHLCQYVGNAEGLPTVTLRLFSVYGPYEDPGRLIPTLIARALRGEDLLLASPETPRDFIFVDDVVDACIAASTRPDLSGQVVNVGTGTQSTLRMAVEAILTLTGSASTPQWNTYPPRAFDPAVWVADATRLREILGVTPKDDLVSGLRKQIAWQQSFSGSYERHVI
jgi:nucleoside-diphosphate-sugar epimerase